MGNEGRVTRRDALRLGAATATVIGGLQIIATPAAAEEGKGQSGQQGDASGTSFTVEIEGCPDASRNIREVALDELNVDARDVTPDGDPLSFRSYVPGETHLGEVTLVAGSTPAGAAQLRGWAEGWASGKRDFRRISVRLLDKRGLLARWYELMDCFPTQWTSVNFDTSSSVQTETIRVKVGRIEFKT